MEVSILCPSKIRSAIMKLGLAMVILLAVEARAQEKPDYRIPLLVSHLSEQNRILLYRKGAPKHSLFSKTICFKKKCRTFIGWRTHQHSRRFSGWEDQRMPEQKRKKKQRLMPIDTLFAPAPIAKVNPTFKKEPNPTLTATKTQEVFVLDDVLFEINSYRLNERHTSGLDSLVDLLVENPAIQIQINGHTDNSGNERYNVKLSRDRAEAVAIYLIDHTIKESRITYEGYGSTRPIASNETEGGRRKNRRVEIIMTR